MAKLKVLPHLDIIDGFKGTVDFYINHQTCDPELRGVGIPCARKWPRSPGKRRAPAVEAQWPAFAYAASHWGDLSPEIQTAYNEMATGTGLSGRDMFTRSYLTGLYRYPTEPPPPPPVERLDELADVEVPAPLDGQILYWNEANSRWEAK